MKRVAMAAICVMAAGPALAQNATATGTGVGVANSRSQSGAVAISGQGGQGGNVTLNQNVPPVQTINTNSNVSGTTTSNINQTVSGSTTSNVVTSGTTSVKTNPAVFAPGLSAAGLETCLGSASGGVSVVGFGLTGGSSFPDEGCQARLDSRTLWSMGLKRAALARLCQRDAIYRSMPEVCVQYQPVAAVQPVGYTPTVSVYASADGAYSGGTIMLIDGKSGRERLCSDYNAPGQKCRMWADAKPKLVRYAASAAHTPTPKRKPPIHTEPVPVPANVAAAPAESKKE
jgi:hypothetical protein